MLLMTLCCEEEKKLIEDIQSIKSVLKSKGIIIGVSESISCGTHFVKIYYGNSDFDEKISGIEGEIQRINGEKEAALINIDENISLYKIILDQYKNILTSNIKYMMQQAKAELHLYAQAGYLN